ncbi:hypothetical protein DFH09DRAFT_1371419 [Mycena vulgaris]|nr:hypothetical protein DFH09DRAFT_1371419 [Mycena vulgaris]
MILMRIPRCRQHLPPPTPTPPLRQHRRLHHAYAPPSSHRPRRIPILPPPQPRSSAAHAPSSSPPALSPSSRSPSSSGRRWGCPSFTEYYHGPPPPPPLSDDDDDDVHTEDLDAALAALHAGRPPSPAVARTRYALNTSRPPPRGFDAFYAFARTPERGCLVTACTPTLRRSGRFLDPSRKRGPPKGSIDAIEARLHQTEAPVGILLAAAGRCGGLVGGLGRGAVAIFLFEWEAEADETQDPLARAILARIDHSAYAQQQRLSAQHPATHPCLCPS